MMNEYEKQAKDFCDKWGVEIKWLFVGVDNPDWDKDHKHNRWHWVLKMKNRTTQGDFWDSIINTQETYQDPNKRNNPKHPSIYDLLSILEKYGYNSFEEFCRETGYNEDSRKDYEIWKKVKLEYDGLVNVFGRNKELWKEFREIC